MVNHWHNNSGAYISLFAAAFFLGYSAFMIYTGITTWISPLDDRLLSPAFIGLIIAVVALGNRLTH